MARKAQPSMLEGPIWKGLISFALPILLGNLFQNLYNTVDTLIVGNFIGKEALEHQLHPVSGLLRQGRLDPQFRPAGRKPVTLWRKTKSRTPLLRPHKKP